MPDLYQAIPTWLQFVLQKTIFHPQFDDGVEAQHIKRFSGNDLHHGNGIGWYGDIKLEQAIPA